jgi:HTH-type transcriptional regulator/antitoxin HigA
MKATLIVIENQKDHVHAKALVEELMRSENVADRARRVAQARLIEAYERTRWPRRTPTLPDLLTYLMDQHGLSRADLVPLLGTPSRVSESMLATPAPHTTD